MRRLAVVGLFLCLLWVVEASTGGFVREVDAAGTITATIHYSSTPSPRVRGNCYLNSPGGQATDARLHWMQWNGSSWQIYETLQHTPIWAGMSWNTQYWYYAGPGVPFYALECTLWRPNGVGGFVQDAINWKQYP